MVARALLLLAVGQCERAIEGVRVRARQHGERGEPFGIAVRHTPRDAAAPVVPDQMKAPPAGAARLHDRNYVGDQSIEVIVRGLTRIGPRGRRIAALARRNRAETGLRQRRELPAPRVQRLGKAVQQDDERAVRRPRDQCIEHEARSLDPAQRRHAPSFLACVIARRASR
jgi:hypothetical protein